MENAGINHKNGFTLTELLITVAIVAILSAIMLPRYLHNEASRVTEAISQLSAIRLGEENYRISNGSYLAIQSGCVAADNCWEDIGIDSPEANAQRFFNYSVQAPTATTFYAIATRNVNPTNANQNQTICLNNTGQYSGNHPNGPSPAAPAGSNVCDGTV